MPRPPTVVMCLVTLLASLRGELATGSTPPPATQERMVEWTIESRKVYADLFNDVEVDVIFSKDGQSWRVPTFWRGGQQWTVRFALPVPGEYAYRLQSTDSGNPDLSGRAGRVRITGYSGPNALLRHGPPRVSANKRYFEHADGTPFYWLGDTWWQGLSSRLSWESFQRLTADRKAKGFADPFELCQPPPLRETIDPIPVHAEAYAAAHAAYRALYPVLKQATSP